MEIGSSRSLKSDINVTPLVDVMLVMLIIFMVVTPLLDKGIEVTLPKARNVATVSANEKEVLVVGITAGGQVFVGDDPVDMTNLTAVLAAKEEENPALQLQIRGDRNARFKDLKDVIRAGREAGFDNAAMIAEEIKPKPGEAPAPGADGPATSASTPKAGSKGAQPWQ